MLPTRAYDRPERFCQFDVETIGWRTLASSRRRYGGRHDRIPKEELVRRVRRRCGR